MLRRTAVFVPRLVNGRTAFTRANHRIALEPNPEKAKAFIDHIEHAKEHAKGTTSLWKNISIATVPILLIAAYYVYGREAHHLSHLAEVAKVADEEWPNEFEYQNVRWKKFFWGNGDRSLFWSWTNHHKGHDNN